MSIFGTIMSKVFGGHHGDAPPTAPSQPASDEAANTSTPAPSPAAASPSGGSEAASAATPTAGKPVDVAEVLDGMESNAGQKLDWRHSIVDLMKLLGMDSSLHARKELAGELHYTGDTDDSASMNIWLHKEVMQKFAANGGKLPADLTH